MAATSRGCSTTQITDRSRRGSVQMAQGSASVMFPHTEHGRIRVLASRMAAARASTSCWFIVRMWKASRWAVFGPMVGNLVSSLISRARGGAEANISWSRPWTEEPGELQPAGHRLHTGRGEVPRLLQGVAGGCDHQILQHGDLLRVHDARVDGDREEVPLTIADGPDGPAPGRALDPLLRQLRLDSGQRFLHLLNLLEDPLHVVHEPLLEGLLETPDLLNGVPEPPHRLLHETTASVRALRRGGRRLRGGGGQDAAESETHPQGPGQNLFHHPPVLRVLQVFHVEPMAHAQDELLAYELLGGALEEKGVDGACPLFHALHHPPPLGPDGLDRDRR